MSLQFAPTFMLVFIGLVEFYLLAQTWRNYCKHNHLRSHYLAIHKIVQSLTLLMILVNLGNISIQDKKFDYQVTSTA
jgi:hypothetical protein